MSVSPRSSIERMWGWRKSVGALYLLLILPCAATAATYHVRTNGSGDCTQVQPCIDRLKPGDTLIVHQGRYAGFAKSNFQGTADKPITIQAAPGERVTLDGYITPAAQTFVIMLSGKSAYLIIDGFEITSSDPKIDEFRKIKISTTADCEAFVPRLSELTGPRRAVRLEGTGDRRSHHVIFKNLEVHHMLGLGFSGDADDSQWLDNHVYDLGYPIGAYGWYTHGARNLWRGNVVHDTTYGFHLYGYYPNGNVPSDDSVIERTLIYNTIRRTWCFGAKAKTGGVGLLITPGKGNIIRNNVVFGNYMGMSVKTSSSRVLNNTFFGNIGTYGGGLKGSTDLVVKNNIFTGNSPFDYQGTVQKLDTNFFGDPQFVGAATHDFHLKPGSPAVDTGSKVAEVPNDFDGVARPKGKTHDIGAYEYTTTMSLRLPAAPTSFDVR